HQSCDRNSERKTCDYGRYGSATCPFLRDNARVLAEPAKSVRTPHGTKEGRKIHQPPADPEAFRASSRIAVFHPLIGCGCKCGCTLLNISNVSSISSGSSVRARLVVSCW